MSEWRVRGVRGATTVSHNRAEDIIAATEDLLQQMVEENAVDLSEVVSVIFTLTEDLDAVFPAEAARRIGFVDVPLMCAREINVPGSVRRCIRVLMHVNTTAPQCAMNHIYLGDAKSLRPDLAKRA